MSVSLLFAIGGDFFYIFGGWGMGVVFFGILYGQILLNFF